ncbi:SEC-C metal-binding domain-containing protein [Rhodopila sp.]|uniref:SEC-C metal-binding domain-containing protein n=1 Tax=Rhodopila sp. TaxID=2480087 RepID=UPI003D0A68AD
MQLRHFRDDLRAARQATEPTEVFDSDIRDDGRVDNAAAHLWNWDAFRPEAAPKPTANAAPALRLGGEPVRNPYRGVGRNDPCPCGSGKKFKNCCLGKVR